MNTLQEIRDYPGEFLTCADIAPILKTDPATLHYQATHGLEFLGFPVIVLKSRVKIPKRPFLALLEADTAEKAEFQLIKQRLARLEAQARRDWAEIL